MLTGKNLICANVGDSRAVLGSLRSSEEAKQIEQSQNNQEYQIETVVGPSTSEGKIWVATSLSIDHKPDRKDEYERIMMCNGRVDPFREADGSPIGPARVWLREENVPGLAMSRSVGDLVAASVGVIPEPEFFELELNSSDKFIVIASDGVWEFITNEQCIEVVSPYWERKDPEGACQRLVELSTENWQREDEVIDDITLYVIFLNVP